MRKRKYGLFAGICILCMLILTPAVFIYSEKKTSDSADEIKEIKLAYVEDSPYYEFDKQFYYLVSAMDEYDMIHCDVKEKYKENVSSQELWNYLVSKQDDSWHVQFLKKGYITNFDTKLKKENVKKQLENEGANMVFTMGTSAGLYVKSMKLSIPFMNFMSADPVKSKMVKGTQSSGSDMCWAQLDPNAFKRSISIMNDLFGPKKVGIVYAHNDEAYVYSGASDVDDFYKKKKVSVLKEYVNDDFDNKYYSRYCKQMRKAHEKLAKEIDVYIMTTSYVEEKEFPYVLEPFYKKKIPVYSINSTFDVKCGALLAAESSDYENGGRAGADTLLKYMQGTGLNELTQIFEAAPYLVMNHKTAKRIGYKPTFDMLLSASKIYN